MSCSATIDNYTFYSPTEHQLYCYLRDINNIHKNGFIVPVFAPKTIIDVGANIGYTVMCWKSLWPDAEITAIEPVPENVEYLRKNVPADVTIIEAAAHSKKGTLCMETSSINTGLAKVSETGISVDAITLDSVMTKCDFLKIDVEGHEVSVLEGAKKLIESRPIIIIETKNIRAAARKLEGYLIYETHPNNYLLLHREERVLC